LARVNNPLVSVCIPTYNGERYILEALECVKKQTYENIELVVSDDNSVDSTLELVKRFKKTVSFPVIIANHKPSSIGANWNHAIKICQGKYIKFLFQDDIIDSTCIEVMVNAAIKDESIGLVFCKRRVIYESLTNFESNWLDRFSDLHAHIENLEEINHGKRLLNQKNFLDHPRNKIGEPTCVMLNKKVFKKVGLFNESLKQSLDYEFWYRILKYYKFSFVNKDLVSFRLHSDQATQVNANQKVDDYFLYPKIVYRTFFWYLNFDVQKSLFFKYSLVGRFLNKLM
jgi:glycosyltransferase involved in cell wall biosynthesis